MSEGFLTSTGKFSLKDFLSLKEEGLASLQMGILIKGMVWYAGSIGLIKSNITKFLIKEYGIKYDTLKKIKKENRRYLAHLSQFSATLHNYEAVETLSIPVVDLTNG